MALVDAVTALRASELIALKWKNVLGHRNPSVRIRFGRRRIEGNQEQEQLSASRRGRSGRASSVARAHAISVRRRLDLCQSAFPWQNAVHLSNPLPTSHSPRDRAGLRTQEQQASAHWLAHASAVARNTAYLERRKCEGHAVAAASLNPKGNPGALRASGFRRSREGTQEGRADGASGEISRKTKSKKCHRNSVGLLNLNSLCAGLLTSNLRGARGCPKRILLKSPNSFEIMVSAAGFEPATHALKGHCSTN